MHPYLDVLLLRVVPHPDKIQYAVVFRQSGDNQLDVRGQGEGQPCKGVSLHITNDEEICACHRMVLSHKLTRNIVYTQEK